MDENVMSFQKFDYRVRLNKSAERRMFIEIFRRLSFFEQLEYYKYIGFGSTTFTDFILFHKALNINDMVSIEKRREYENRFNFNIPFDCVKIKYGESNEVLPQIEWNKRAVVWLDYDGKLTSSVLRDTYLVSTKIKSGSILITTVNAEPYKKMSLAETFKKFKRDLEPEIIPAHIKANDLCGEKLALTCKKIISTYVHDALKVRNGILPPDQKIEYKSLFNFTYKDGAKMLTVGGIFVAVKEKDTFEKCKFDKLNFVCKEDESLFEIKVPVITPRERHYLDQRLPRGASHEAETIGLLKDEIENYKRLYRYCPNFAEVELV